VAESFRSKLRSQGVRAWIASVGRVEVGYAVTVLRERPANALCLARQYYELDEIGVAPAHRRQGVARALVERVVSEAKSRGVPDVELTSWAFNSAAHDAFRALGFQPMIVRFRHGSGFTK